MDGRKATGGKLEVRVKLREPLSGVEVQPVAEKWLVLDPVSSLSPPEKERERVSRFIEDSGFFWGGGLEERHTSWTRDNDSIEICIHLRSGVMLCR